MRSSETVLGVVRLSIVGKRCISISKAHGRFELRRVVNERAVEEKPTALERRKSRERQAIVNGQRASYVSADTRVDILIEAEPGGFKLY